MPPWQGGGDMILSVSIAHSTYNALPWKFEAGTPNISGAIGLAAAMDYLEALGRERVAAHEQRLLHLATAQLAAIPGLPIVGTAREKAAGLFLTPRGLRPAGRRTTLCPGS